MAVVTVSFLDSSVPQATFCGVYDSQLIRFVRASSQASGVSYQNVIAILSGQVFHDFICGVVMFSLFLIPPFMVPQVGCAS